VKKSYLLLALVLIAAPSFVRAEDNDGDPGDHRGMNAKEMTGIGIGGAAVLGVAGYLILRKRTQSI
jgi:hypothetical protein